MRNSQTITTRKGLFFLFFSVLILFTCFYLLSCNNGDGQSALDGSNGIDATCNSNRCATLGLNASFANSKIINGTACENVNSPIVQLSVSPPNEFSDICTGTLISANTVLTAGHCLAGTAEGTFVIHQGTKIAAERTIIHPEFRIDEEQRLVFNDVGLIVLSTPVNVKTLPILISKPPVVGEKINIYGFGLNSRQQQGELNSGQMEISSTTSSHIQARFELPCSNTCGGDSGGPAIQIAFNELGEAVPGIIGILSSGTNRFCNIGDVSSYTFLNNPSVIGFILSNTPSAGLI